MNLNNTYIRAFVNLFLLHFSLRGLRYLSVSKLSKSSLSADDFLEFGLDLEKLQILASGLKSIKNNAFKYVHGIKSIDFSDNNIDVIEKDAFADVSFCFLQFYLLVGKVNFGHCALFIRHLCLSVVDAIITKIGT